MMKVFFRISAYLLLLSGLFCGCSAGMDSSWESDYYSGENFENEKQSLGTLILEGYAGFDRTHIALDNDTTLLPIPSSKIYVRSDIIPIGQRAIFSYKILPKEQSYFNGKISFSALVDKMENILTKEIEYCKQPEIASYGSDPISPTLIWIGGGYINIEFKIKGTNTIAHSVSMVKILDDKAQNNSTTLELRHNANGDAVAETYMSRICFKLDDNYLSDSTSKVNLTIEYTDFDDTIKRHSLNSSQRQFQTISKKIQIY